MRTRAIALGIVVVSVLAAGAADVLSQLGLTAAAAKEAVGSIINAGIINPGLPSTAFKLLPPAARADAATTGVEWLKAYVGTSEFKQQYAKIRSNRKPEAPTFEGTPEDELKKANAEQAQQSEDSKKALAALPADQRKQIEDAMKQAQEMAAKMDTPEMRTMRLDAIKAKRDQETKQYQKALADWQRDFPENPNGAIAKRLREFLAASADVDFNAKLKPVDGRMLFENSTYQNKPEQWKLCFRAGKEATTAARAAVQAWLKELGG
jgi:flagellar biosynthesis GTPase FlhF